VIMNDLEQSFNVNITKLLYVKSVVTQMGDHFQILLTTLPIYHLVCD